jgi:hypothetical protein
VKPLSSRARLGAAENFFSLRFRFNDPAKKVVLGHFLWGLRLRSIDPANPHEVAGLDVETELNFADRETAQLVGPQGEDLLR